MTENPELGDMNSDTLSSFRESFGLEDFGLEEKSTQKVSLSNQIKSIQNANIKSDSFTVDMERFSHLTSKDVIPNSRITLQRNFSRKGSQRGGSDEKKMKSSAADNERHASSSLVQNASSPRDSLVGASTPEKPILVTVGGTNQPINQQIHHQITITTAATTTTTTESKLKGKRYSFKRSSPSWTIDPRRILFFFATLSSMGTVLLIYFTLSMRRLSGDDNILN